MCENVPEDTGKEGRKGEERRGTAVALLVSDSAWGLVLCPHWL